MTVDVVTRTSDATIGRRKGRCGVEGVSICGLLHVRRGRREQYESNEGGKCAAMANGRQAGGVVEW